MSENNYNEYNDNYYDNEQNEAVSDDKNDRVISSNTNKRQKVNKKTPKRKKSKIKRFFAVILIIVIILVLLIGTYTVSVLKRIQYNSSSPDSNYIAGMVGELKSSSDVENIMIFGTDNHGENENGRADSMILLSIDKKNKTIKMTSFLRDLYLNIPGYYEDKLNASYSYGGAALAVETIEYNFGIKIDNYVVIDFQSFISVIDALGGIDIELMEEEIDYINWQCWKNKQVNTRNEMNIDDYKFYTNNSGNEVAKVHLNGRQALWHARNRGQDGICSGDDFMRTQRQRVVMDTVFANLKSADIITLMKVIYDVAPMITTNISSLNIISFAFSSLVCLNYDRKEYSIPQNDNYYNDWANASQILCIYNMELEKERLYDFIFEQ